MKAATSRRGRRMRTSGRTSTLTWLSSVPRVAAGCGDAAVALVHHTPSPALQDVLQAVREGVALVTDVELTVRPALSAGAADVLAADGILLGTPANIGYMSGAMKHFFDTIYYPCLDATPGLPYGVYVHSNNDTAGARTSIERITRALRWKPVAAPLSLTGAPDAAALEACRELAATVAASL